MAVGNKGGASKYVALRARNEFMPFDPDPANRYQEPYGRVAFARRGLQRTRWRRGSRTEGGRCRASDSAGWYLPVGGALRGDRKRDRQPRILRTPRAGTSPF